MNNKLQELTEKLYNEGLSKGQQEGLEISRNAQLKAEEIIRDAQAQASLIVQEARREAEEARANAETEMKLAARQVISEVKQTIEGMLTAGSIAPATKAAFDNAELVQSLIKEICGKFNPQHDGSLSLSVAVPAERREELMGFVASQIAGELGRGIEVKADQGLRAGFKIGPKDGGYYISFTNDAFDNLFKDYLRPKVNQLLFGTTE